MLGTERVRERQSEQDSAAPQVEGSPGRGGGHPPGEERAGREGPLAELRDGPLRAAERGAATGAASRRWGR